MGVGVAVDGTPFSLGAAAFDGELYCKNYNCQPDRAGGHERGHAVPDAVAEQPDDK